MPRRHDGQGSYHDMLLVYENVLSHCSVNMLTFDQRAEAHGLDGIEVLR